MIQLKLSEQCKAEGLDSVNELVELINYEFGIATLHKMVYTRPIAITCLIKGAGALKKERQGA